MKAWTRWQNWVAVAAGLYAALSTIWTPQTGASLPILIVLGILLIIAGLWSLAAPQLTSMEWIEAVIGALLFISPWVTAYATQLGAAWTSWICGGVGVVVGLWAVPAAMSVSERVHHGDRGHPQASH